MTIRLLTAADLEKFPTSLPSGDVWYELDDGVLVVHSPSTARQGRCQALVFSHLHMMEASRADRVLGRAGIILRRNPDRVVGPAVSLLGRDQWPPKVSAEDFLETIPKLIVEIRSKYDTSPEVGSKVAEYLAAGAVEVWVLDPETQTIAKHRADGMWSSAESEILESELLPGFYVRVDHFFAE